MCAGKCSEDDCNPGWLYGKDSDAYDHYPTDTVPVSDTLTPAGSTISFNVTEDNVHIPNAIRVEPKYHDIGTRSLKNIIPYIAYIIVCCVQLLIAKKK